MDPKPPDPPPLASPLGPTRAPRLVSLDAFRGLVIAAMLLVNNVETADAPRFLKHADWIDGSQADAWRGWWAGVRSGGLTADALGGVPLLAHCTLADYVMPCFLLVIGVAIPFSAAAQRRRGVSAWKIAGRTLARGATLVMLGWAIAASLAFFYWYHAAGDRPLRFTLGMDVLQLLGVSYVVARAAYALPTAPRLGLAGAMYVGHWALLRFHPQPGVAAGTFTAEHNAASVVYATWPVFAAIPLGPCRGWSGSLVGMLSVVPAAATMVAGTWVGDALRSDSLDDSRPSAAACCSPAGCRRPSASCGRSTCRLTSPAGRPPTCCGPAASGRSCWRRCGGSPTCGACAGGRCRWWCWA